MPTKTQEILRNPDLDTWCCVGLLEEKSFVASTDSDNFEAVILSTHNYVLKVTMVNKKKPHPLVFVGGV